MVQFLLTAILLGWSAGNLEAQTTGPSRFLIDPVSRLHIHGKSNVNTFTCTCRQTFLELPFNLTAQQDATKLGFRHTVLIVQTRLFDCGNKVMNEDMYHALKSKKFPQMAIELDAVERIANPGVAWTDIKVWTKITLAGETRQVWLPAKIRQPGPGRWHIRTKKTLRMTDFKVTPPTALMGMIKTNDEITIELDLLIHWLP
jgi:hypothetical protein